jgi:hypothetical protein
VKRKADSKILRKYNGCVKYDDISDTTTPRHKSTDLKAGNSCADIGPETET